MSGLAIGENGSMGRSPQGASEVALGGAHRRTATAALEWEALSSFRDRRPWDEAGRGSRRDPAPPISRGRAPLLPSRWAPIMGRCRILARRRKR